MNGDRSRTGSTMPAWRAAALGLLLAVSQGGLAEEPGDPAPDATQAMEMAQVQINHADARTIAEYLDGVGLTRAEAIVEYREAHGAFTSADDLALVNGIGEVTLERNRDRISVD